MALPSFVDAAPVGSIKPKPASSLARGYDPRDWRIAETVLASSLRAPGPSQPAIWSDADTGAHGEFVAAPATFTRDGQTCRAFVARLVEGKTDRKMHAVGCPDESGEVTIFEASPWIGL